MEGREERDSSRTEKVPDMSDFYPMARSFMSMLRIYIKDEAKKYEVQRNAKR